MYQDDDGPVATMTEAVREYTRNVGADRPDREWICSPYDTWERNPYYRGAPGPHPEDDTDDEIDRDMAQMILAADPFHSHNLCPISDVFVMLFQSDLPF